ncbi:MAG: hypothetical protein Aurels2KO_32990 [Aureliella sp.]
MLRIPFIVGSCLLLSSPCAANNSYFIPGDAFFYFEIEQSEWKALKSGKLTIVDYDRPEEMSITFCGYAGYKKLDLSSLSGQFRGRLIKAITSVKEKYPTRFDEIDHGEPEFLLDASGIEKEEKNKIRVFVHNSSHDFSQLRIALKYNESWAEAGVQLGLKRDHFRYDFFVPTPEGISESWRMGTQVSPLNVELPDADRGYVTAPMKIDASKVTFLICPPVDLPTLCYPPRNMKLECFAVSESATRKLLNNRSNASKPIWLESK